jgi:hypothetical protein
VGLVRGPLSLVTTVEELLERKKSGSGPESREYCRRVYLILPTALGPEVHSASNRNEYQKHKNIMFLGSRARPVRKAGNLSAICEPIV